MSSQGQGPGLGFRGGFQISQGYVDDILETFCPFGPELRGAVAQRILSLTSTGGGGQETHNQRFFPYTPIRKSHPGKGPSQQPRHHRGSSWASRKRLRVTWSIGPAAVYSSLTNLSVFQLQLRLHQGPTSHWRTWRAPATTT